MLKQKLKGVFQVSNNTKYPETVNCIEKKMMVCKNASVQKYTKYTGLYVRRY